MASLAFEEAAPLVDEESGQSFRKARRSSQRPEKKFCSFMLQQQILDLSSASASPIAKKRCMMATVPQACGYVPRGQHEVAAKSSKSKQTSMLLRESKLEIYRNESKSSSGPLEGHNARARLCLWRKKCSRCSRCLPGTVHEVCRTEIQWQYQQAKHKPSMELSSEVAHRGVHNCVCTC